MKCVLYYTECFRAIEVQSTEVPGIVESRRSSLGTTSRRTTSRHLPRLASLRCRLYSIYTFEHATNNDATFLDAGFGPKTWDSPPGREMYQKSKQMLVEQADPVVASCPRESQAAIVRVAQLRKQCDLRSTLSACHWRVS